MKENDFQMENTIQDQTSETTKHAVKLLPSFHHRVISTKHSRGPIRGFRDTGYSRKKLPGYGIFEEKVIGIEDIDK